MDSGLHHGYVLILLFTDAVKASKYTPHKNVSMYLKYNSIAEINILYPFLLAHALYIMNNSTRA